MDSAKPTTEQVEAVEYFGRLVGEEETVADKLTMLARIRYALELRDIAVPNRDRS